MRCPDRTPDEHGRLRALAEYQLDASCRLSSLEPIVDLAAGLFRCPGAAVNLVGEDSVFFAASHGITSCSASRDFSFCAHAIVEAGIMVVEDATLDERFHGNPLVENGLIRFYAGVALSAPSGHALGALCIIDNQPHSGFTKLDRERLVRLAALASDRLELRRMEVATKESAETLKYRSATSPNAVISCDEHSTILGYNASAERMFSLKSETCGGQSIQRLVDPQDRNKFDTFMQHWRTTFLPEESLPPTMR